MMNPQAIELASILNGLNVKSEPGGAGKACKQEGPKNMFARLLDQTLSSANGPLSHTADQTAGRAKTKQGWLEHFRNQLLCAGVPLKNLFLSRNALPGLEKLLMAQGYSEKDVNGLLQRLFGSQGKREIKIIELFEGLSELKMVADKDSFDPAFEVSVVPHLETLLRCLGLDVTQAKWAISHARVDGGGVGLKRLVQSLKGIINKVAEGTKAGAGQPSAQDIKAMLVRIGMADGASKVNEPMSLERFVQMLEKKVANLMPHHLTNGQTKSHATQLLDHVLIPSDGRDPRSGLQPLSSRMLRALSPDDFKGSRMLQQAAEELKGATLEAKKVAADKQIAQGWKRAGADRKQAHGKQSPQSGGNAVSHAKDAAGKQIAQAAEEATSNAKKPAAESAGLGESDTENKKSFSRMDTSAETSRSASAEKTLDQKNLVPAHSVREAETGRAILSETTTRQGPRPVPQYVIDQVARRLGLALRRGDNHVRLQLKPPQLGSIQLDMVMKDNVLKVALVAEHHFVKELLTSHVNELRQALGEQGVELQKVDVEVGHHFGRSMDHAQRDLNEARSWRRSPASASDGLESEADSAERTPTNVRSDALLDMFA